MVDYERRVLRNSEAGKLCLGQNDRMLTSVGTQIWELCA